MNSGSMNSEEKNEEVKNAEQPVFDINKLDKNSLKEFALGLVEENEELKSECEEVKSDLERLKAEYDKTSAIAAKAHDLNNMYKNISSDFDAYKKRNEQIWEKAKDDGIILAALKIIPIYDNLLRATNKIKDENDKAGINMIAKQFEDILDKMDIKKIDALGEEFDHNSV